MKKSPLLFPLLVLALSASAQKSPNKPANIFMSKLPNGLELLVLEDRSVPLVTIEMAVRNGSYTEDNEYNGLSHLYEHMFFKANKDIPSQEKYLERVQELGISFNGTTSQERVNYFFTLGSKDLDNGLRFMNSAIRYPLFLQEEMKKENPVVDGEFQRAESNPAWALFDKVNHKTWGAHYSRKNPIGDHDIILTATPEKMRIIKDKYYYPDNSILLVAGDVKHEDVFRRAKEVFGDWKAAGFDPFQRWPIPEFETLKGKDSLHFVTISPNAKVPILLQVWHGPDTRNDLKATLVADVFSYILSQKNSRFQKNLIDSGYALNVGISYQTAKFVGPIQVFCVPNPAKFKESFKALAREIAQFDSDDYFTDEQLETSKIKLANSEKFNMEATTDYIHSLSFWWASATLDYYFDYIAELNKVTRKDIQDYVRKYIKNQPSVAGLLLSPDMQKEWNVTDLDALYR
ncbi:M16 family metallopeptidase [Chitinophaga sp. NPDC101104]|uniref:M16 family metallopeptidase n=1 Tax=Chitinophaga sp. NPDC101104 TaxID=3390561 RepID=UPI003CFF4649